MNVPAFTSSPFFIDRSSARLKPSSFAYGRRRALAQCAAKVPVRASATMQVLNHEALVCTVVNATYSKVVSELTFAHSADFSYPCTREFTAALMCARRWGIKEGDLKRSLSTMSHQYCLPSLTALQRETVQAFVSAVYDTDDAVDMMLRVRKKSPAVRTASPFYRRCAKMNARISNGATVQEACKDVFNSVAKLERECLDMPHSVVTREQIPRHWTFVLTCVIIYLRVHVSFD